MKYSRGKIHKRKRFLIVKHKAAKANKAVPRPEKKKTPLFVIKKIGGAKNGGERKVYLKKSKAYYPTKKRILKRGPKGDISRHVRNTRKNMKSGRILILLAGRHAGKRVVLMKVLKSGLLLVNGPFYLNGCPLRRISQRYVLGTSTRLSLTGKELPEHIDDKYFKRDKKSKKTHGEGDIFATKKETYTVSEQRKKDQIIADDAIKGFIKKHKEHKMLSKYLKSRFGLKSNQYPHRMKF